MTDFRIDIPKLASSAERCFDLSADGRLSDERQRSYLLKGKQLRVRLRDAVVIRFETETAHLKLANSALSDVNTKLQSELDAINRAAETIQAVADLVGKLDAVIADASAVFLGG